MAKRSRVLLDVDGVLADFTTPTLQLMQEVMEEPVPEDVMDEWDIFRVLSNEEQKEVFRRIHEPGWCEKVPLYDGAQKFVADVQHIADIYFVTSPMGSPTWTYERERWLYNHFAIPRKHVVHTIAKYLCVGDILVDDKPDNIKEWITAHPKGTAVLWEQPYNKHFRPRNFGGDVVRMSNFNSLYDLIADAFEGI